MPSCCIPLLVASVQQPLLSLAFKKYEGIPLPKCKSEKSREVAFILLNELAVGCPSNLELVSLETTAI